MKRKRSSKDRTSTASIAAYDAAQSPAAASVCRRLRAEIERALPDATSKVWHGSPVWFVGDMPVVGYNVAAKGDVLLLFWNGQVVAKRTGWGSMSHRYDFMIGSSRAVLTVSIPWWCELLPFCELSAFSLQVDGEVVYAEGKSQQPGGGEPPR